MNFSEKIFAYDYPTMTDIIVKDEQKRRDLKDELINDGNGSVTINLLDDDVRKIGLLLKLSGSIKAELVPGIADYHDKKGF